MVQILTHAGCNQAAVGLQLCSFFAAVNNLGTQDLLDGRKSRAKGVNALSTAVKCNNV